jgi:hypothetical protein
MAAAIPGAGLRFFEGGHQFLWDDPDAFPTIGFFLDRQSLG